MRGEALTRRMEAGAMRSAYEHLDARLSHPALEGPFQDKMLEAFTEIGIKPNNGVTPEHLVRLAHGTTL